MAINVDDFFFRLYDLSGDVERFLGSAFPVTPRGDVVTCRHVLDGRTDLTGLYIHDNKTEWRIGLKEVIYPSDPDLDLAFIPNALGKPLRPALPILPPKSLAAGVEVFAFGSFQIKGGPIEQGYFSGRIVNLTKSGDEPPTWSVTLPFPVIEGMSGSPILAECNGPKVVGVARGNRETRVLASEIVEYSDDKERYRETVNRIVEFGLAYHCHALVQFLSEIGAEGWIATDGPVEGLGLNLSRPWDAEP